LIEQQRVGVSGQSASNHASRCSTLDAGIGTAPNNGFAGALRSKKLTLEELKNSYSFADHQFVNWWEWSNLINQNLPIASGNFPVFQGCVTSLLLTP